MTAADDDRAVAPLAHIESERITIRGFDLADDLIGRVSFSEMLMLLLTGEKPSPAEAAVVDGILVALMEHGLTPSTIAARLVLDAAPESMQGAIAAGMLAAGDRFLGSVQQAAALLQKVASGATAETRLDDCARSAVNEVLRTGGRIPGFGHNIHGLGDPRVAALQTLARQHGVSGIHLAALEAVRHASSEILGTNLVINAVGVVGAILSDLRIPAEETRGFALVARSAGLFAHLVDERCHPRARLIWQDAQKL